MTAFEDNQSNEEMISSLPIISLETPFADLQPRNLDQLLECLGESWDSSATSGFTGFIEDDTIDSRDQPKRKTKRGGRRKQNSAKRNAGQDS
mmetsp:Transcript_12117/g.15860  ORF Transcript_12117/g.15860 Transcript_12117/m.15860 type:complete len:92 (+) Transcript_12117:76-351(+)|eukprot:CAMPEP_0198146908 /NCGR_PEP_ID=MMETSP1443-20131203/32214_1 /TAXON_ID=186043 /ORGANISM="Entomoneis sp., Strain CCMP2396" /LENGTH=91 /DNA_ID=CAMNT_0043811015 /DNA_START=75 /DNA_END=350 /DNA_ORIENTATION=+